MHVDVYTRISGAEGYNTKLKSPMLHEHPVKSSIPIGLGLIYKIIYVNDVLPYS